MQYVGIYLPQNYSMCFRCHRTFCQRGLIRPHWQKVVALIRDMTCTRSCGYSFMCSWWWVRWHQKHV